MLLVIHKFHQLSFSELVRVYSESLSQDIHDDDRSRAYHEQMREAEQEFYDYLNAVFFRQKNACYVVLEENGRYISALRLEPYMDGFLICALETAPEFRRKGFAEKLMRETVSFLSKTSDGKLYSHIAKNNTASLVLHEKCGFKTIKDYARYLDGSVFHDHVTMLYEYRKTES